MSDVARIAGLLEAILGELRELRREHAPPVDARFAALLAATHEAIGDSVFSALSITAAAAAGVVAHGPLARALAGIVGRGSGGVRRLGRFLAAHGGESVGGLRLVRLPKSRDGVLYYVAPLDRRV